MACGFGAPRFAGGVLAGVPATYELCTMLVWHGVFRVDVAATYVYRN